MKNEGWLGCGGGGGWGGGGGGGGGRRGGGGRLLKCFSDVSIVFTFTHLRPIIPCVVSYAGVSNYEYSSRP